MVQYHIVKIGENELVAILDIWITKDGKKTYYPPGASPKKYLKNQIPAEEEWKKYKIFRNFGTAGKFL